MLASGADPQRCGLGAGSSVRVGGSRLGQPTPETLIASWGGASVALSSVSEALAERYTCVADDSAQGMKKREAAVLLSAAEGHLEDDEDTDEATRLGNEALDMFRGIGDLEGAADAQYIVVEALRLKAAKEKKKPDNAVVEAKNQMEVFVSKGDKRGQAAMQLALAKINTYRPESKFKGEGMRQVGDAIKAYGDMGDKKMEAVALVAAGELQLQMRGFPEAIGNFNRAMEAIKALGDKKGEAKVIHGIAKARFLGGDPDMGIQSSKEALKMVRELGNKKMEACELLQLSTFQLDEENFKDALALGKEAATLFQELAFGSTWHMSALHAIVRAYLAQKDGDTAVKFIRKELQNFREQSMETAATDTLDLLANAMLENKDADGALPRAEECLSFAREASDKRRQAVALYTLGEIQYARKEYTEVLATAKEAGQLFREIKDIVEEGYVRHQVVRVQVAREKWADALRAAKDAQDSFHEAGDKGAEGRSLLMISGLYFHQQEDKEAVAAAMEASFFFQDEKDRPFQALAYYEAAVIHAYTENYGSALRAMKKSMVLARELENRSNLAVTLSTNAQIKLGLFIQNTNDNQEAKKRPPFTDAALEEDAMKAIEEAKSVATSAAMAKHRENWDRERRELIAANWLMLAQVHIMMKRIDAANAAIAEGEELAKKVGDEKLEAIAMILTSYICILEGRNKDATEKAEEALELSTKNSFDYGEFLANNVKDIVARQGGDGDSGGDDAGLAVDPEMLKMKINDVANSLMGIESLAGDTPLMDAGLDSLSMVEFRNELVKEFPGVDLPGALLFDYPTVNSLAEFVADGIRAQGAKALK
jgi:acyl carrier protein